MSKFRNPYRIESTRLPSWNYANDGRYFVTICTKKHLCFFGKIANETVYHTQIGKIACAEILNTTHIRHYGTIDEWIVMPNHVHAIIEINHTAGRDDINTNAGALVTQHLSEGIQSASYSSDNYIGQSANVFGPQSHTPGSIVRGYKSAVTTRAKMIGLNEFGWQSRFYDIIIRNDSALLHIRDYIRNNVKTWKNDFLYSH